MHALLDAFHVPPSVGFLVHTRHPLWWPLRHWAKHNVARRLSVAYQMAAAYLRAQQVLEEPGQDP